MDPKTFREYDIRGIVGEQITEDDVRILGKTFGTYMANQGKKRVVVARDCRPSSEPFRDRLIEGMLSTGQEVTDIGICPTPLLYFSLRHLDKEGGIMITASHNPPEYNGFKICNGYDTISGQEIQKIRNVMEKGDFVSGRGTIRSYDITEPYVEFIKKDIHLDKTLRIGLDAGNAVGGPVALPLLQQLGCEVYDLYCDMDGNFPNHPPDPTVLENLKDLIALVKKEKLLLGIAYDGDCDRIGVVDNNGDIVYGDKLMIIFAREILSRKPGSVFISEVKCSKTLYEDIENRGGKAIMWRTGHSLIKAKMKEINADLAGEMSGHMFFKDRYFGFDDAIYASCRLLEILSKTGKTIKELLEGVPKTYSTPEIRVECPDEIKFVVVEKAKQKFQKMNYKVIDIDGARIVFNDGWGLVRASNTQPALVLRYEADTPDRLDEIRKIVEGTLDEIIQ